MRPLRQCHVVVTEAAYPDFAKIRPMSSAEMPAYGRKRKSKAASYVVYSNELRFPPWEGMSLRVRILSD